MDKIIKALRLIKYLGNSNFTIPVYKIERELTNKRRYRYKKKEHKTNLKTNFWELSVATSLAYISKQQNNINVYKKADREYIESFSVMLRLISTFDAKRNKITASSKNTKLADFARTSRIGEIGQGFSYLLTQNHWKHKYIIHLADFVNDKKIVKSESEIISINKIKKTNENENENENENKKYKIADFIAFKNQGSIDAIIIESKAGYTLDENNMKSKLTSSFQQLNSYSGTLKNSDGDAFAEIKNSYAVCTSISGDEKKESFITYFDPENIESSKGNIGKVIRHHYAKFFLLSGQFNEFKMLQDNKEIDISGYLSGESLHYPGYTEISNNGFFKTYLSTNALNFLSGKSNTIETTTFENNKPNIASFSDGMIFELDERLLESFIEFQRFRKNIENF